MSATPPVKSAVAPEGAPVRRHTPPKGRLELRKYDPTIRKHVPYKVSK